MQVENQLIGQALIVRKLARVAVVFLLSYATAYMETLTIAHVSCGTAPHGRSVSDTSNSSGCYAVWRFTDLRCLCMMVGHEV